MQAVDVHYRRLAIHGLAVQTCTEVPRLNREIDRALGIFEVADWPAGFSPLTGTIRPYHEPEVLRHLSPLAQRIEQTDPFIELYQDADRFWLIDDRWGLAEINLLKGEWHSWVLPEPRVDAVRCVEMAVIWPLAQLLRARELHLVPAVSVARGDRGVLLLSPFGIEPELRELLGGGWKIIGQRWTALREEEGRVALLHMPGQVQRDSGPRPPGQRPLLRWTDLLTAMPKARRHHAFCDTIVLIEPGRRQWTERTIIPRLVALESLRKVWPIIELHPQRRHGRITGKLAQCCRCWRAQLSRRPRELPILLDSMDQPLAEVA